MLLLLLLRVCRLVAAAIAIQRAYRDVLDYRWHEWHARPKVVLLPLLLLLLLLPAAADG